MRSQIEVRDFTVAITHKDIKNLHLSVLPPDGRVRVAAPRRMSEQAIRIAVISKLAWMRRQQRDFAKQPRQSSREMIVGESHYVWGHRYRLSLVEQNGNHTVLIKNAQKIELRISPGTTRDNRLKCLNDFYRQQMKLRTNLLIDQWQTTIGVEVDAIGIKKLKTKWGSCNLAAKRIWLNLELAKKPPECLEYILVHEMVHLLERHHNDRFRELITRFMPNWRENRDLLNSLPLAYEDWLY